jgi:hypothetical protein
MGPAGPFLVFGNRERFRQIIVNGHAAHLWCAYCVLLEPVLMFLGFPPICKADTEGDQNDDDVDQIHRCGDAGRRDGACGSDT